jgi:hypothetical protein
VLSRSQARQTASSDGINAIGSIVSRLPADLRAAISVLQHRGATVHDLQPPTRPE